MVTAQNFKWLPNTLTILRALLAIPIYMAATNKHWALGFWLIGLALSTDFLDGLAAKKLNAQTKLGALLDMLCDFVLAATGLMALAVTGHLSWWLVLLGWAIGAFIGYERWLWKKPSVVHQIRPMFSVVILFLAWALGAWGYATQAWGWRWWYVPLTIAIVVVLGLKKQHRIRVWYAYILDKRAKARTADRRGMRQRR